LGLRSPVAVWAAAAALSLGVSPVLASTTSLTISGARFLGREKEAGPIEVGKSGDFIVLNQDILKLADEGHAEDIRNTGLLETWFMGKRVYVSNVRKPNAKRG